jgi:glycosyltransferase involved in cell wall biosynthesis
LPPPFFYKNFFGKKVYKAISSMCDDIVMACADRSEFLLAMGALPSNKAITLIENFPDKCFVSQSPKPLNDRLQLWLNMDHYFLCQGGYGRQRAFLEIIHAAILSKNKIVFVGPRNKELITEAFNRYGERNVLDFCFFSNSVPQMDLIDYIDMAVASVIFYKNNNVNNWYCAPNRFYQSIARGTPVITGNNPLFVSTLAHSQSGLVVNTDGSDSAAIAQSLTYFIGNKDDFKVSKAYEWNAQHSKIINLLT